MLRKNVFKGVLGLSAASALFAVLTVQAQTTATDTGKPGATSQSQTGQASGAPQTGTTGGTGNSSTSATGMSGTSGSSQAGTSGSQAGTSGRGQAGATASGTAGTLSKSDQKMLMNIAQANMAEIEAGKLAQSKSQNDEVKRFAQQMIDDHTKALDDVKQVAQNKSVTLPTDLDSKHKAMASKLSAMSGDAFDKAYLAQAGVADHKKNHSMLQQAQGKARDPDVKALVARTMPVVDQHLSTVQQLNKSTARGGSKTQGTTGSSSDKSGSKSHDSTGTTDSTGKTDTSSTSGSAPDKR